MAVDEPYKCRRKKGLSEGGDDEIMLSVPHMIVVFLVVLVVFGPQKLPELARSLGKLMAEFRKASVDFRSAFEEEMRDLERQARIAELRKQAAEAVTAATTAEIAAQNAQNAKNATGSPEAAAAGTAALPEPFSAENRGTDGPVITPVAEAVPRIETADGGIASREEGSNEVRGNEAGSDETRDREARSNEEARGEETRRKEAGSNEAASSTSAENADANGDSSTDKSLAPTESTPSHDQQQPA